MNWTSNQRLLGIVFGVVGLLLAVDRARQPNPGVMESLGILTSSLIVGELLTRATARIDVTDDEVRVVAGHTVRTIPLSEIRDVERRVDDVRLVLVDGSRADLEPAVPTWVGTDASHAAGALAAKIDAARLRVPQYSTVTGLRRRPRGLSLALAALSVALATWLVLHRWFV